MGLISSMMESLRFKDTIIYKESCELQDKYDALKKLSEEYPNNNDIKEEMMIIKKGLNGENEVLYQLKKANIGMYVIRDFKLKYEDMTAQVDFVLITPVYTYYIECKNLLGNIFVNEKGDFIREYVYNGQKVKKGMYSPLRQVEAQREVIKKFWASRRNKLLKMLQTQSFDKYRKVLVVVANQETILNTTKAPKDMKYKVLRTDALVRQLKYDYEHRDKDEILLSQKNMETGAKSYLDVCAKENIDYYKFYKAKYCIKENKLLKDKMIEFRNKKALEKSIPLHYIFDDDELEILIKFQPKSVDELKNLNILAPIKIKLHGKEIIEELNKINN